MASDKAWYWLAAGVLALGLNGAYQDGEFAWAHRIADRSCALLEQVTERGDRFIAMAEIMLGRDASSLSRVQHSLARAQNGLARVQERLSEAQVERIQRHLEAGQCRLSRAQVKIANVETDNFSRVIVNVPDVKVQGMTAMNFADMPNFNFRAFTVNVPVVEIPEVNVPAVRIPEVRIPRITVPQVRVPQVRVRVPDIKIPAVRVKIHDDASDGLI